MKKIVFIVCLLVVASAAGRAQESRQDVSVSGTMIIPPFIASSTDVQVHSKRGFGALASYRFMLTPNSALEANYGITYENDFTYYGPSFYNGINVPSRVQEISGAYVRTFVYRNWNPWVEGGPAAFIFLPIINSGLQTLDTKQQITIGAVYGAGIAYEVSPSYDIRVGYRGLVTKVPTFGTGGGYNFTTNKWFNMFEPVVGVAYHF
ncbi:MAG: outer membrane beta-barrel protein [Acidobacteriota bacterium]